MDCGADALVRFNRYTLPLYMGPGRKHLFDVYTWVTAVKEAFDTRI